MKNLYFVLGTFIFIGFLAYIVPKYKPPKALTKAQQEQITEKNIIVGSELYESIVNIDSEKSILKQSVMIQLGNNYSDGDLYLAIKKLMPGGCTYLSDKMNSMCEDLADNFATIAFQYVKNPLYFQSNESVIEAGACIAQDKKELRPYNEKFKK